MMSASPIDLTTLAAVKQALNVAGTNDDALIQFLITSWSSYFLWRTGCGGQDQDYSQSPFADVCDWSEVYDGNGTWRLFLRNYPVTAVSSLNVNGVVIGASSGVGAPGYVIDATGKSVSLRLGGGATGTFSFNSYPGVGYVPGGFFTKGIQNVAISYSAGFAETPFDIQWAANVSVGVQYKRAQRRDQASQAMGAGAGTISFRDWVNPPEAERVIVAYTRYTRPGS